MRRVLTATIMALTAAAFTANAAQAKDAGNVAGRLASTVVGTVIGLPIAIVRTQYRDVIDFTNGITGNSKNKAAIIAVQPLTFVPAVANGLMEGIINAPLNAWKYSDQPFSPQTFSLGDLNK